MFVRKFGHRLFKKPITLNLNLLRFKSWGADTIRIVMMGPPGSGKGTYAARASAALHLPTISTGDLLRHEIAGGGARSEQLNQLVASGRFVADAVVQEILQERLHKPDCDRGFILDGYPRTLEQVHALDQIVPPNKVILLDMRRDFILRKMMGRRMCVSCGFGYNVVPINEDGVDMPALLPKVEGKCDKCNQPLVARLDDVPEVIERRLEIFDQKSALIIAAYEERGILMRFNAAGLLAKRVDTLLRVMRGEQADDFDRSG